jgi:oligoribonuclease NrnB/cAMP/cGMP phosphodiesterase (DHH superfamily)
LYHGSDLDGHCSGAIYAKAHEGQDFILHPIDYGDPVPWELVKDADVTLIDFSIQPKSEFVRLMQEAKSTTWIDHHRSAIQEWENSELPCGGITMVLDEKFSGCELAWRHYFAHRQMPDGVRLLGRYDVWDHAADERVLPYQYGMRFHALDPSIGCERELWGDVLVTDGSDDCFTGKMIQQGCLLLQYQSQNDAGAVQRGAFDLDFEGKRWIACNRLGKGSRFFDAVWDADKYDGMLSFGWDGDKWCFGLYSDQNTDGAIDCGAIAKEYGGGGHPGAAGFQAETLPFDL